MVATGGGDGGNTGLPCRGRTLADVGGMLAVGLGLVSWCPYVGHKNRVCGGLGVCSGIVSGVSDMKRVIYDVNINDIKY